MTLLPVKVSETGEPIRIAVRELQVRKNFGRTDVLIEPVNGTGSVWVSESRLERREDV